MIPVRNLYYMLAYAYRFLRAENYQDMALESFQGVAELYARIFLIGMHAQLKQGLLHKYEWKEEELKTPKGRILFKESLPAIRQHRKALFCEVDDFSVDCPENQLLKSTLLLLQQHREVTQGTRQEIAQLLHSLAPIGTFPIADRAYRERVINSRERREGRYRELLSLCGIFLDDLLLTNERGENRLRNYADDQRLSRLYEKFLLAFFQKHYREFNPKVETLYWPGQSLGKRTSGKGWNFAELLPVMRTDMVLKTEKTVLVIDAKYYSHPLIENYQREQLHSANVYQLHTYMSALKEKYSGRQISGLLLYAQSDDGNTIYGSIEFPDGMRMGGETLNLGAPFEDIANALHNIIATWLPEAKRAPGV